MHLRARNLLAGFGLVMSALLASQLAAAAPPQIIPNTISVQISNQQGSTFLNLRQLGVVAGSAPLTISQVDFLINGTNNELVNAQVVDNNGPGHVCIVISNQGFSLSEDTLRLRLSLVNANNQTVGPVDIPIADEPGPTFNPQNPEEIAACDDPNSRPVANAGVSRTVPDSDNQPGESNIVLDGSGSVDPDPGSILTYQWFVSETPLGPATTSPTLTTTLPDGENDVLLVVTDDSGDAQTNSNTASVQITVQAAPLVTANAGPDQTVNDTDGVAGEIVTLDAGASNGQITSYQWVLGETILGTDARITPRVPDGVNSITLVVLANDGEGTVSDSDIVQVTVNAPAAPGANAGADRTVADSDGQPGETVTLDGSASTTPTGTITAYNWYLETGGESRDLLGSGVTLSTSLPDGINNITLEVTNSAGLTSSDSVQISVDAAPERTRLSELPNLTPNQKRMANALDDVCSRVLGQDDGGDEGGNADKPAVANQKVRALATEAEQSDLASKCRGLLFNNTAANQVDALDELNGEDFAVARTQTLLFANFQQAGILDRLMALRGGAKGLSLAGLNIMIDGKAVPLATLQKMAADLFGGGASSDADEAGGLLSDKWGMWMRGNYSSGKKDASDASPSFDADQFAIIGGLDYRLSDKAVIGASLAYGDSSVEFNPRSDGALDTTSWALSAYGSMYAAQNFYFDAIFNYADSDYAADRNITYVDGQGLVNADATGDTGGMTLSGGLSLGYDFLVKGLTISPNVGAFYIDATIDSFTERGAGGLNLIYDEQNFKSLTTNLGFRVTYAWNHNWGVLLPHVRVDYVREFEDDVDVFGIRFAADPNAGSTPPILVETDNPDTSYWRLAAGFSAQFQFGFSGYIEYQRLESFQFISFQDISVGLRMQKSF